MLVLAACALAIPRSRDLHASTTRLEADLDAIETLIAERRRSCGETTACDELCYGGGKPAGNTAADAVSVVNQHKAEVEVTAFHANEFNKCDAACMKCKEPSDENCKDVYLVLPLKDGSGTKTFQNCPIFLKSWCG